MITIPADLNQGLIAAARDVRIVAEISGLTNSAGRPILYANGPLQVSGSDVRPYLTAPETNNSKLSLTESQVTFSAIGFQIVDKDGEITSRLDDFAFKGKTLTIKLGTASVPYASYIPVYVGMIQDLAMSADSLAYDFSTIDIQINLDEFVFILAETKLTAAVGQYDVSLTVEDAAGFALAGPFANFEASPARGHVLVGSGTSFEIMEWRSKTATTLDTVQRAQKGTSRQTFTVGTPVKEVVIWPGHPLEILSVILSGATIEEPAAFASVPASWKLGNLVSLNAASWLAAKDRTRHIVYEYRTLSKQFARNLAQLEILQPLKLFLRSTATNTLGLVALIERPIPLNPARQILKDRVKAEFNWEYGAERMCNQFVVLYDYDLNSNAFLSQRTVNDAASQATYGIAGTKTISLKGLRTELGGSDLADLIGGDHFSIFAKPTPEITLRGFAQDADLEVGDAMRLTHPRIPAPSEGSRGAADRFLKVIEVSLAFASLSPFWKLYDADIPSTYLFASVAADGTSAYGSASATEQAQRLFFDRSLRLA